MADVDQKWIILRFTLSYWTPIDPKRRLSDADAVRIFSLRGPNILPPAVVPRPPWADEISAQMPLHLLDWLTLPEAAALCHWSQARLCRIIAAGQLTANVEGRINGQQLRRVCPNIAQRHAGLDGKRIALTWRSLRARCKTE